jgi:hypothetical protein
LVQKIYSYKNTNSEDTARLKNEASAILLLDDDVQLQLNKYLDFVGENYILGPGNDKKTHIILIDFGMIQMRKNIFQLIGVDRKFYNRKKSYFERFGLTLTTIPTPAVIKLDTFSQISNNDEEVDMETLSTVLSDVRMIMLLVESTFEART